MTTRQHFLSILAAILVCLTLIIVVSIAVFHPASFSALHQFSQVPFYGPWP